MPHGRRRHSCSDGACEIAAIAPSTDCSRATVCPHGSARAPVQQLEAVVTQFLRRGLDRIGILDFEFDAGLGHRVVAMKWTFIRPPC
jgi:hypothetical protein